MSHQDYIADLNEDQIVCLVELSQAKLKSIRDEGWVKLWVVGTDFANEAWFAEAQYKDAVDRLGLLGHKYAKKGNPQELSLELVSYRPTEAARLLSGR